MLKLFHSINRAFLWPILDWNIGLVSGYPGTYMFSKSGAIEKNIEN
jgi:hypothetical protein